MPEQFTLKQLYDTPSGEGRKPQSYTLATSDLTFVSINTDTATPDTIALTLGELAYFVLRIYSVYDSLSADWESVYTNSNVNSGEWELASSPNTTVNTNSADWESVYSHIKATSGADTLKAYAKVNANGTVVIAYNCSVVKDAAGEYTVTTQNYEFTEDVVAVVSGPRAIHPGPSSNNYWTAEPAYIESTSIDINADGVIEVNTLALLSNSLNGTSDSDDRHWTAGGQDSVFYIMICGK
tara:strand:+ start:331 stop:1047 length:717 start_codon:yes stop_codon:yes gene_type:complete